MHTSNLKRYIRPWTLPIAMVGGILLHEHIGKVAFLSPFLIFIMLTITYCKVSFRELKPSKFTAILLSMQLVGAITIYFAIRPLSEIVAQGTFICMFCPTATAAPVITGMLGGSVARLATFSLFSNVSVALLSPMLLTYIGDLDDNSSFIQSTIMVGQRVLPLLILPLATAFIIKRISPKLHTIIIDYQSISFYIWAVALFIVVGNAVSFVLTEPIERIPEMLAIAMSSLAVCCIQFWSGRRIGTIYGDKIAGAQGLGQKNTILAIWLSLTYLHPIAAVGPASYILWQNTINSLQLYDKKTIKQ